MKPSKLGDRYTLIDKIGSGYMGDVWLARGVNGGIYAAKVLREHIAGDPRMRDRFLREGAVMMAMRHKHLVRVQDLVLADGKFGIVMDYIEGGDLSSLLKSQGRLETTLVAQITAAIAEGLECIHNGGVVHRDIKPKNILLDRSNTRVRPLIADFGIAYIVDPLNPSRHTSNLGTAGYASPEMALGLTPGPASDVYSLGVLSYEALCGQLPFSHGSPIAMLRAHAEDAVPRLNNFSDGMWELVSQMLEKEASKRPAAVEVAQRMHAMAVESQANEQSAVSSSFQKTELLVVDCGVEVATEFIPNNFEIEVPTKRLQASAPMEVTTQRLPENKTVEAATERLLGAPVEFGSWRPEPRLIREQDLVLTSLRLGKFLAAREGPSSQSIAETVEHAANIIDEALDKQALKIESRQELSDIASHASGSRAIGRVVSDVLDTLGRWGMVKIELSDKPGLRFEVDSRQLRRWNDELTPPTENTHKYWGHLKSKIISCESEAEKERLRWEFAELTFGTGVVAVGTGDGLSAKDRAILFRLALNECEASVDEGWLPGDGVAWMRALDLAAEQLRSGNDWPAGVQLLATAFQVPLKRHAQRIGINPDAVILAARRAPNSGAMFESSGYPELIRADHRLASGTSRRFLREVVDLSLYRAEISDVRGRAGGWPTEAASR